MIFKNINDILLLRGRPFDNAGFGWQLSSHIKYSVCDGHMNSRNPIKKYSGKDHVFCYTLNIDILENALVTGKIKTTADSILLIGGHDATGDHEWNKKLRKIKREFFKEVYFEGGGYDDELKILPNCLVLEYLENSSQQDILSIINQTRYKKTKLVGACAAVYTSVECSGDRYDLFNHLKTKKTIIKKFETKPETWWKSLSSYKFLCSPSGIGNQCSKTYEALLTNTIPIMIDLPHNRQLKELFNLPILLVSEWSDITRPLLNKTYKQYTSDDWLRAKRLLTVDGFAKKVLACNNISVDKTARVSK